MLVWRNGQRRWLISTRFGVRIPASAQRYTKKFAKNLLFFKLDCIFISVDNLQDCCEASRNFEIIFQSDSYAGLSLKQNLRLNSGLSVTPVPSSSLLVVCVSTEHSGPSPQLRQEFVL